MNATKRVVSLRCRAALLLPVLLIGCVFATGCALLDQSGGVVAGDGHATFAAQHDFHITVPEGAGTLKAWFAMPQENDPFQTIEQWNVDCVHPLTTATDQYGNQYLYLEVRQPPPGDLAVETSFLVTRREVVADVDPGHTRPHTEAEREALAEHLKPSSQSAITAEIRQLSSDITAGETNPVVAARKIYDWVLGNIEYHVKDPKADASKTMNSTGTGSSALCLESGCGNCTDFHSLYAALSRAAGIPTRAVYGSFFKAPLDGVDQDQSYHCWLEFHAPDIGWVPLDVAVADVFVADFQANEHSGPRANLTVAAGYQGPDAGLVEYYFGNLEERRVSWHWGRDLVMEPRQAGEPLLWNPKAYVEIDGKAHAGMTRKLTFTEIRP